MVEGALPIPRIAIGDAPDAKRAAYRDFLECVKFTLDGESDAVAAMATVAFLLSRLLPHASWSGFYRVDSQRGDGSLVVGPYVSASSMGCLRIPRGKGVCGGAAEAREALVVPDVSAFPGHIACASATRSELVVPLFEGGDAREGRAVAAVVDLDSEEPAAFDDADAEGVAELCAWLGSAFFFLAPLR